MTTEIVYLRLDDLILIATAANGGRAPEIADYGLLESALARPQATVFGEDAYPTLALKAAALCQSLVKNHALVDGNKRLGTLALLLFLGMNDHTIDASEDEKFDLILAVADGSLDDVAKIAARIEPLLRALR